jgi:hypothetical protein
MDFFLEKYFHNTLFCLIYKYNVTEIVLQVVLQRSLQCPTSEQQFLGTTNMVTSLLNVIKAEAHLWVMAGVVGVVSILLASPSS